jgi:hypothetical protein
MFDTDDVLMNVSMLEQIMSKGEDGDIAIIALVFEEDEAILDQKLSKYKTTIVRFDAAAVAAEVEEAERLAEEMARQVRLELRKEKKAEIKAKREEKKAKLVSDWEALKAKLAK